MVRCPCCDALVTKPRSTPVTSHEAARAMTMFKRKGLTREALLTQHRAALEFIAPGFIDWLNQQPGTAVAP